MEIVKTDEYNKLITKQNKFYEKRFVYDKGCSIETRTGGYVAIDEIDNINISAHGSTKRLAISKFNKLLGGK